MPCPLLHDRQDVAKLVGPERYVERRVLILVLGVEPAIQEHLKVRYGVVIPVHLGRR